MRHVDVEERLLRKRLAVRVIALRNEKDWSQSELSRRLGDRTRGRVIRLEKVGNRTIATVVSRPTADRDPPVNVHL